MCLFVLVCVCVFTRARLRSIFGNHWITHMPDTVVLEKDKQHRNAHSSQQSSLGLICNSPWRHEYSQINSLWLVGLRQSTPVSTKQFRNSLKESIAAWHIEDLGCEIAACERNNWRRTIYEMQISMMQRGMQTSLM